MSALLGIDRATGTARVCAYCPDAADVSEFYGDVLGLRLTHGICPSCLEIQLAALAAPSNDLSDNRQSDPAPALRTP